MGAERALSLLVHPDQWARCAHQGTALLPGGGVELTWIDPVSDRAGSTRCGDPARRICPRPAGLAFDQWCRAFRSRPELGRVDLLPHPRPGVRPGSMRFPGGLAVDRRQRLYVAETQLGRVHVFDLRGQRILRRVPVLGGRPIDVAPDCGGVLVLVDGPARLVRLDGRRDARPGAELIRPCFPSNLQPRRITCGPLVLWRSDEGAAVVARPDGAVLMELDGPHDIDANGRGLLVIASAPGEPFRRFQLDGQASVELEPVEALGFDGEAIAIAPNGRIAFTTRDGLGWTSGSAARHIRSGSVVSYRLDSGAFRTRWGRLFFDGCLPEGTSVGLRFVTSDEENEPSDAVEATPPSRGGRRVPHPADTPPLAPRYLLEAADEQLATYRRSDGGVLRWGRGEADTDLHTYEAPVTATPGRYLWLQLNLYGTELVSPRIRSVRIERPGHDLLGSLPRSWSRDDGDAAFLQRFLAPADGLLHDLDRQAELRNELLSPRSTPPEALAWLASLAGLVLDLRWPETARRQLIAEAYSLFRRRGTKESLVRMLELYLGYPPTIVEQWQVRGLGGTVLGTRPIGPTAQGPPAVGGTARTTGTLGRFTLGDTRGPSSSFAHRFTVLIRGTLDGVQRQVVTDILDDHRPAHTLGQICELGDGMRIGSHIRVGLTAYVGPSRSTDPSILGRILVGDNSVVGQAETGARLGLTARVGEVMIG